MGWNLGEALFGTNQAPASFSTAQQNFGNAGNYYANLGGLANTYAGQYQGAQQGYNQFNPQANAAIQGEADYLGRNPDTNQFNAARLAQMTQGDAAGVQMGNANTASNLASRGFTGNSSIGAGDYASIQAQQTGQANAARNQLTLQNVANQGTRLSQLSGLLGGAAGNYYQMGQQALGGQAGAYGAAANGYSGVGNDFMNLGGQQNQMYNQRVNAVVQPLSSLAGGLSSLYGQGMYDNTLKSIAGGGYTNPDPQGGYG